MSLKCLTIHCWLLGRLDLNWFDYLKLCKLLITCYGYWDQYWILSLNHQIVGLNYIVIYHLPHQAKYVPCGYLLQATSTSIIEYLLKLPVKNEYIIYQNWLMNLFIKKELLESLDRFIREVYSIHRAAPWWLLVTLLIFYFL